MFELIHPLSVSLLIVLLVEARVREHSLREVFSI
jgi:hypothetical protein